METAGPARTAAIRRLVRRTESSPTCARTRTATASSASTTRSDDDDEDSWDAKHGAVFLANIDDDEQALHRRRRRRRSRRAATTRPTRSSTARTTRSISRASRRKPVADGARRRDRDDHVAAAAGQRAPLQGDGRATFDARSRAATRSRATSSQPASSSRSRRRTSSATRRLGRLRRRHAHGQRRPSRSATDTVRMRVAPVLTYHHLLPAEKTCVSSTPSAPATPRCAPTSRAACNGGRRPSTERHRRRRSVGAGLLRDRRSCRCPAPDGAQHVIRVNYPLGERLRAERRQEPAPRRRPRRLHELRGKDVAGDPAVRPRARRGRSDTLNSFGNFETIPPLHARRRRATRSGASSAAASPSFYPDKTFVKMIEAQEVQPPRLHRHVVAARRSRRRDALVREGAARRAAGCSSSTTRRSRRRCSRTQSTAGNGDDADVRRQELVDETAGAPRRSRSTEVLADTDVMSASAEAAAEVAAQLAIIKAETGLTDAEIIQHPVPPHDRSSGDSIAYQPGHGERHLHRGRRTSSRRIRTAR